MELVFTGPGAPVLILWATLCLTVACSPSVVINCHSGIGFGLPGILTSAVCTAGLRYLGNHEELASLYLEAMCGQLRR